VFNEAQALPRYIVRYEVTKKVKFTPLKLASDGEDSDEEDTEEDEESSTDEMKVRND